MEEIFQIVVRIVKSYGPEDGHRIFGENAASIFKVEVFRLRFWLNDAERC